MDLIRSQISEIKDLELIYIFSTDSVFNNQTDKYLEARIVFNKNQVFALNYKSEYFEDLLQHILHRYNQEKSTRKIILLGSLTKKFVSDFSFLYQQKDKFSREIYKKSGIPSFATKANIIKHRFVYFEGVFKQILEFYEDYKNLSIDSITGYNNKYVVKYHDEENNNQFFITINIINSNKIKFLIKNIEGKNVSIEGTLEDDFDVVKVEWHEIENKINGFYHYDTVNDTITQKISMNDQTVHYEDDYNEVTKKELELLEFYLSLCNLSMLNRVLKVNENNFILTDKQTFNELSDECFYTGLSYVVNILDDEIWIKVWQRDGFNKYDNRINGVLSQKIEEYTLKAFKEDGLKHILIERKMELNGIDHFSHTILEASSTPNFDETFDISDNYKIDKETIHLDKVKQLIKTHKRGE